MAGKLIAAGMFLPLLLVGAQAFAGEAQTPWCQGSYRVGVDKVIVAGIAPQEETLPATVVQGGEATTLVPQAGDPAAAPVLVAGRCGSSDYYCNETGATYCCGNSTDGYYCAADVNGCDH